MYVKKLKTRPKVQRKMGELEEDGMVQLSLAQSFERSNPWPMNQVWLSWPDY